MCSWSMPGSDHLVSRLTGAHAPEIPTALAEQKGRLTLEMRGKSDVPSLLHLEPEEKLAWSTVK